MSGYQEWADNMYGQRDHFLGLAAEYGMGLIGPRIPPLFDAFVCGDPDRVEEMVDHLNAAKYVLNKDLREHLGGAQLDMAGWVGDAAADFLDYLLQLEDAIGLLTECLDALIVILRSHAAVVLAMRQDALNLVDLALQGIEAAGADDWKVALAVVGAVAGVLGTVASLGTATGALVEVVTVMGSAISGSAGVAGAVIDASSELGVLDDMIKAGEGIVAEVREQTSAVDAGLRELARFVSGTKLAEVRPDRPDVITAPSFDPGSFGMTDEAQGRHPRPTDTTDLVPEPKRRPDGPYDRGRGMIDPDRDRYEEQGPA
ncbi:hypothetical protein AB0425_20930 [Actinosynnema sp. NPDC051121]|nr:hypothetical protein [Saccharothrix sp.]